MDVTANAAGDEAANPLGAFLRARRELVDPGDHGIRENGRRRVRGLRREELAFLAGVSAPYYARLEQGRDRSRSPSVLDAIGAVLRLDAEALAHLHRLAAPAPTRAGRRAAAEAAAARKSTDSGRARELAPSSLSDERVSPLVQRLLDAWPDQAAVVIGRYRDVVAANPLAIALNPGFAPGRNLVRDTFLDAAVRELYPEWRDVALGSVAGLHASAGASPDDPELTALVGELSMKSDEFRMMWARHDVHAKTTGLKRWHHPLVGALELEYQTFDVNGADGQVLHVFSAAPGTSSADAFALLAATSTSAESPRSPQRIERMS